jgi:glycosyltransferase involved in cell wall biosynthesis
MILARVADCVVLYDTVTAGQLVKTLGAGRVFVSMNTIDLQPIERSRAQWVEDGTALQEFRRVNRLPQPLVLFVSRLSPENRLDIAIEALVHVRKRFPQAGLAVVGSGESECYRLRELSIERGVEDSVTFAGSQYDELQLAPWFLAADVFCYPTNIGLSAIHALAYGIPVVTSSDVTRQNPEIYAVKHGATGLLVGSLSAEAFAAAICQLLDDPALSRRLGQAGRQVVADEYALEQMVDGLEAAIRAKKGSRGTQIWPDSGDA